MNIDSASPNKKKATPVAEDLSMDEFDFKPITSGLGFHHNKPQEVKPVFTDKAVPTPVMTPRSAPITPVAPSRKENQVYQNDLSLFYQAAPPASTPAQTLEAEAPVQLPKSYARASKQQRTIAYVLDLLMVASVLGLVLTIMARTISMDLVEVWTAYPHEITPLVLVLFAGFYLIYFSIFEKSSGSTLGKHLLHLRVVDANDNNLGFGTLVFRSLITLANFLSLGLFAWFDLQNKVTGARVVRVD